MGRIDDKVTRPLKHIIEIYNKLHEKNGNAAEAKWNSITFDIFRIAITLNFGVISVYI